MARRSSWWFQSRVVSRESRKVGVCVLSMKPYQRAIILVVSLSALVGLAEAQAPAKRPWPWVDRGVTFTASEGRVLYVDARSVGPGMYYFVVRITVARDVKASPDDRVRFPEWFQFVADDGRIYTYSSRGIRPDLPRIEQCPQERYLLPGTAITCDLIFLVPSNVTRGTVEVSPPNAPPVPITIRE